MSSTDTRTDSSSDATPDTSTLINQVEYLKEVVMTANISEDSDDLGENIAALIKQVDTANQVAEGVESKLDKLLENLEDILQGLEHSQTASFYAIFI